MDNFLKDTRKSLRILLLPTFCLAQLLDAINISGANVALPHIQEELGFSIGSLQWVISAYTLTFGGFLMLAGRLGDVYGHRNFFILGLLWFTVFAIVSGFSTSSTMMIISRGLQGIGAASTVPNAVALILRNYKMGRERNQAMSFFGSTGALGFVLGLIIGGLVTESSLGWRWIFYLSGIISATMAVIGVIVIPPGTILEEDAVEEGTPKPTIDVLGAVLSTASMILFVYVLTDANNSGWSNPRIISLLIVSVILMAAFVFAESRIKQPLMPLWIWRLPNFAPAFVIAACLVGFFQGYLYFVTLIFQDVFHYSPIQTAVHYLPLGIIATIVAISSEHIIHRFNIKVALIAGLTLGVIGNIILSWYNSEDQYWRFAFPSFVITVTGLASVYVSSSIAAVDAAPGNVAGIVGGMLNTAFQIGGGLGLAILVAVSSAVNPEGTSGTDEQMLKGNHAALWAGLGLIAFSLLIAIVFVKSPDQLKKKDMMKRDAEEKDMKLKQMEEGKVTESENDGDTIVGLENISKEADVTENKISNV